MKRILLILCALYSQGSSAGTRITCPDVYPSGLLATKGVPDKWTGIAHVPGPGLLLHSAGVIAGPPQRKPQGIQRGVEKKTKKGLEIEFSALDAFTEPLEKWVYCAYGGDGEVQLLQRIPDDTKTCVAALTKTPYGSYSIDTMCK
jgi:hypothetical protein